MTAMIASQNEHTEPETNILVNIRIGSLSICWSLFVLQDLCGSKRDGNIIQYEWKVSYE